MSKNALSRFFLAGISLMILSLPIGAQDAAPESEEEKETEKKWDVNDPPGPRSELEIDVDEGTWISLDVSPDGQEIVFDLLGDLYRMPISGGDAQALTEGFAWDMQPRYSPDGKLIAYTSDAGGGDNIWVMDRDGSNPRQVTKETFRLLNSPAWSPDGQYIAARKHFTSGRSLGAGEIWLYHISGGQGLQMVKRLNDQKDLGEPAFSPDGRYLYFSLDSTPGRVFQYNKDPNSQIYTVRRLDRQKEETLTFLSRPGGSIRPTPSPDGKTLAFVRRVRYKSVLFLHDIASGREWPIYDGLERDMQETWAIHGVYPSFAWTPDNRTIVFWAQGGIHRIDVKSKQVDKIPFRVRSSRTITEAVRSPIKVGPEKFDVKMLRWVQVAPAGDKVVYQALGHLYVRDLPDGEPSRLTAQMDHFEFYPSWSRDGRSVTYVSWDDDELGAVRVVSADGGEGRQITTEKGHYVEPVFSPSGDRIVFRRVGGGFITSPLWSRDRGIYVVSSEGGEAERIVRNGFGTHFGADPESLFFVEFGSEGKRILKSIGLDGQDERSLVESANATEFRVSPDGSWLAFSERFNCYIAPFVATGQTISIGPKTRSIPVQKVSRDAGEYLHWSGDSSKLHWSLGPDLFTRDVSDTFDFVDGGPEELPKPEESGANISFQADFDRPAGRVALVGGRIVTMRGDEVIEDGVVVIEGNRITHVGPSSETPVPSDALRIDTSGHTLLPGILDVHAHGPQGTNELIPQQNRAHFSSLSFGVTTVHDPSNDTSQIFAASEMASAGLITAPRIFSTGTILYGAAGSFKAEIESLDDARRHLRRMKAVGAFSVKSYNQPRRNQRQQVLTAARELEMMVVPEGGSLFQHNMNMVVDGHTGIEHSIPVAHIYDDVLQLWPKTKVGYTPTLVVGYGGRWGEDYWYQKTQVWANERLLAFVPREFVDSRSRRRTMIPDDEFNHINNARICKELIDAGGHVQIGAHGQREGLAAHWEIWMLVQGGMTTHEALRAATLDGAGYLGLDGDLGSIEAGKLADIIVLEKNPLEDIRNSEHIRYTVVNGRVFDARSMDQLGNHPSKRARFYFEQE